MKARPPAPLFHRSSPDRSTPGGSGARWTLPPLVPVFAHQGGWDEILLVVGPLALIGGALWLANRRVTAQLEATEGSEGSEAGKAADTAATPAPDHES